MKRILLFLGTNLAVVLLASMTFRLLGFESILYNNGVDLNLQALLVFCALLGFGGSFVSLLMSKPIAKARCNSSASCTSTNTSIPSETARS